MDKINSLEKIIDQLDIITYIAESATLIRIGDFEIAQQSSGWSLVGRGIHKFFNTRMAAIGYARSVENDNQKVMLQIEQLDKDIGGSFIQVESIFNAAKKNPQIFAKVKEAEIKHRENMQELADLVLHIL